MRTRCSTRSGASLIVLCLNCRSENLPDALFCVECGTRIDQPCRACGTTNPPASKFCRMIVAARRGSGRVGERDALLIMIAYRHGLRASELIALRWDQVELKAGLLHVARLKHASASTHPLRGPELRALRAWKRKQGDATPYVFMSLRGGPMTRRTVHHVVASAANS